MKKGRTMKSVGGEEEGRRKESWLRLRKEMTGKKKDAGEKENEELEVEEESQGNDRG